MSHPPLYVLHAGRMQAATRDDYPAQRYVTFEEYEALAKERDEFDVRKITVSIAENGVDDGVAEVKAKSIAEVEELITTLSEAKDDFHESWVTASKDNERLTKALTWIVKAPHVSGDNGPDMREQMRIVAKAALENEDISDKLKEWVW